MSLLRRWRVVTLAGPQLLPRVIPMINSNVAGQKRRSRWFHNMASLAILVCVIAGGLTAAHATIMKPFGLKDLCRNADMVAWVEIGSATTLRAGKHGFIYTDHEVQLVDVWYASGAAVEMGRRDSLTLRQIGGRLGDSEQSVVGTAPLKKGQRWLVFVRAVHGRIYLVGMGYGGWRTVRSANGWRAHPGSLERVPSQTPLGRSLAVLKTQTLGTLKEVGR